MKRFPLSPFGVTSFVTPRHRRHARAHRSHAVPILATAFGLLIAPVLIMHLLAPGAEARPVSDVALVECPSLPAAGAGGLTMPPAGSRDLPLTWFGNVDADGNAIAGDMWTFDHGGADEYEGWTELAPPVLPPAWRRIDDADRAAHGNPGTAPVINGTGSAWAGLYQDEADDLGWAAGTGYGNNWAHRFVSPVFTWDGDGAISLAFHYWTDLEDGYDYVRVYLVGATGGVEILLPGAEFTHIEEPTVFYADLTADLFAQLGENDAQLVFAIETDQGWSDEDGYYDSVYGPFAVDDISLTGNVVGGDLAYTFESGDEGFTLGGGTPTPPSFYGIAPVEDYEIPCDPVPLTGNVLHLHDGAQEHPDGQRTILISPPVILPEPGCSVVGVADVFAAMPYYDGVFYRPGWLYTTDGTNWSERTGNSIYLYNPGPICLRMTCLGDGYVPSDAIAVKLVIEIYASCEDFGIPPYLCTGQSNASPLFDNIRVGAIHPGVLQVPTTYPTLQAAIDASDADHPHILVWDGIYQGDGNSDLQFTGHDHAVNLRSIFGPQFTVLEGDIDHGLGVNMQSDMAADPVLIDGFMMRGYSSAAVYYDQCTRPLEISNCIICDSDYAADLREGTVSLSDCEIRGNHNGCHLDECFAEISNCTIAHNVEDGIAVGGDGSTVIENSILWGNEENDLRVIGGLAVSVLGCAVDPLNIDDPLNLVDWGSPDLNVYVDPFFCDPRMPAVTLEGDYRLDAVSPCLPEYSPSGLLIGALGAACDQGLIASTPTGSNVPVELGEITLTFDTVTTEGDSREITRAEGPEVPSQYSLVPADPAEFHLLTTTAGFEGQITICMPYDEGEVTMGEESLRLLHYDAAQTPPAWVDVTSSIDMEENIICGLTSSLSPFVVAEITSSAIEEPERDGSLRIHANRPNPMVRSTVIAYELPQAARVSARIFNVDGRLVRVLLDGELQTAGHHQLHWDGRNDGGQPAEAGFYFYRVNAGDRVEKRQLLLVR